MKFYSQEYCDEVKEKINSDEALQAKVKNLTVKMQVLLRDCPGGVDKLISSEIEKGKILRMDLEEKPAPSDWREEKLDTKQYTLRAAASYDTYAQVNKGEVTAMQAMGKGDYKTQGDMMRMMGIMPEMQVFDNAVRSIPVEY